MMNKKVGISGEPIEVICFVDLEPVGKDWDGDYKPILDLDHDTPIIVESK